MRKEVQLRYQKYPNDTLAHPRQAFKVPCWPELGSNVLVAAFKRNIVSADRARYLFVAIVEKVVHSLEVMLLDFRLRLAQLCL